MAPIQRPKTLIARCDSYDPDAIAEITKNAMRELQVEARGKTLLKPNCVVAIPDLFPHAFTRGEVVEGVARAIRELSPQMTQLTLGERSGITIPTRYCFKNAGYFEVAKRLGLSVTCFDEEPQVPVRLHGPDRLRDAMHFPRSVAECDFLVNIPKFKAHPWTRMTLSLKNLIGAQDDRFRLLDHNSKLERKIADINSAVKSDFIVVDAITAGQKMMLTPEPFHLGALIFGTNACATDAVCAAMVNVDPKEIDHLRISSERGLGPINLDEIDIVGDLPLSEVQERSRGFQLLFERIDTYFKDMPLTCTVGSFPEAHSPDYCWGGCPGALQEAINIFLTYHPDLSERMRKVRYVVGKVEGPLNLEPDEKVLFIGDCTSWEGEIDGKPVKIESMYGARRTDPMNPPSNDMILKILSSLTDCAFSRGRRYVHATGCPVSVAAHINYLSFLAGIPNVNFDMRNVIPVNIAYLKMRLSRALHRCG